jgi:hypothetical protein
MPVILATQEAEIRRIVVQSQSKQIVCETLSQKTLHKSRADGVAKGEGPEFKLHYHKKKKEKKKKSDGREMDYRETFSTTLQTWHWAQSLTLKKK